MQEMGHMRTRDSVNAIDRVCKTQEMGHTSMRDGHKHKRQREERAGERGHKR